MAACRARSLCAASGCNGRRSARASSTRRCNPFDAFRCHVCSSPQTPAYCNVWGRDDHRRRECDAHWCCAVLRPDPRIPALRDAPEAPSLTTARLPRCKPQPRFEVPGTAEQRRARHRSDHGGRGERSHPNDLHQVSGMVFGGRVALKLTLDVRNAAFETSHFIEHLEQQRSRRIWDFGLGILDQLRNTTQRRPCPLADASCAAPVACCVNRPVERQVGPLPPPPLAPGENAAYQFTTALDRETRRGAPTLSRTSVAIS